MKLKIISLLFFIVFSNFSFAQNSYPNLPHVTTHGTANVKVTPDFMRWSVEIETVGNDLETVAIEQDRNLAQLLTFLDTNKIESQKTKTSRISLKENWVYRNNSSVREGYNGSATVTFETSDLDSYRTLWIGLSKLPHASVKSVVFDTSERIEYQNKSRIKAVKAAKKKAKALAEALDSKIAEVLVIEEEKQYSDNYGYAANFSSYEGDESDDGDSVSPGTVTISTSVEVSFRIISN